MQDEREEAEQVIENGNRLLQQIYSRTPPQLLRHADKTIQLKYENSTFSIIDAKSLSARSKVLEIQKQLQSEDENQKPVSVYFSKALPQLRPKEQDSILFNELQYDVLGFYHNHKNLMQFYSHIEKECKQPFREYYDYIRSTLAKSETTDLAMDSLYYRYVTCLVLKSGLQESRFHLVNSFGKCLRANNLDPIYCKPMIDKLKDILELQITNVAHLEKETIDKVKDCRQSCTDTIQKLHFLNQFHDQPSLLGEEYQQQLLKELNKQEEGADTSTLTLRPTDLPLLIEKKKNEMEHKAQHCVASIFCPNIYKMESTTKEQDIKQCFDSALPLLKTIKIVEFDKNKQ